MFRAPITLAAAVTVASLCAGDAFAGQQPQAPPMQSVLAGKKLIPPVRGEAVLEWAEPSTRREKDMVVTRLVVRNASNAPIARLTINESWYDKGGANVTAGRGVINGLLQPGEVQLVVIETPWKAGMSGYQRQFAHANGTVKQVKVAKLEAPKGAATTTTATTAKPTTAKPTTAKPTTAKPKPKS
jgi:hypothetical protein